MGGHTHHFSGYLLSHFPEMVPNGSSSLESHANPSGRHNVKTAVYYGSICSVDGPSLYFVHPIFDVSSFLFLKSE